MIGDQFEYTLSEEYAYARCVYCNENIETDGDIKLPDVEDFIDWHRCGFHLDEYPQLIDEPIKT